MFNETLSKDNVVCVNSSSKGTQIKYKKGDYWYKEDTCGHEGTVESLISKLLSCSSLDSSDYVVYEKGNINGKRGCRSVDFTQNGAYSFITLEKAYYKMTFESLSDFIYAAFSKAEERYDYVIKWFEDNYQYNLKKYFDKIFSLDLITLNTDRHFNNLGFLYNENEIIAAPIFDNGLSLLNGLNDVDRLAPIEECVEHAIARPFSGSHEAQFTLGDVGFLLDYKKISDVLSEEPDTFYRKVLLHQLDKYKKIFNNGMFLF